MAPLGDHWIRLINCTLGESLRVGVNVSNDLQATAPAFLPDQIHPRTIELNVAPQGIGVDVVVRKETLNHPVVSLAPSE